MEENPYQPPNFSDPPEIEGSSPRELEYRAFVGRNARYYLRKWSFAPDDSGSTRGFNWAAFLLSGLWLPYRKMYRVTFIFYSILVGTSVLAELAAYAGVASENALSALDQVRGRHRLRRLRNIWQRLVPGTRRNVKSRKSAI